MYGNIESSQAEQGQMWVLGPGDREACSDLCPTEENLYEPLDPAITVPSQKHVSDSPSMAWARAEPSPAGPNHAAVKASAPQFCPSRGSVVTHPPFPASGCRSRDKLVLVGAVALGVSVLVNVVLLTVGSRHVAALTEALEAEKAKELPNMVSQSFLLYNEDHRMCVEARGRDLAVTTCQPEAVAQRFQWLQGGRLWGWGGQHCITATSGKNLALVRLEPCRDDSGLQRWECREGGLLALAGYNLYFNYGNNKQRTVMLYTGDREWSRWVIHGSKDNICSRSSCSPCPKGWTYWGNSCYFYSKTPSSWDNAQRFCSALGTQLLEVDGTEEKGHIQSMLQGSSWLGISDAEVEGTWKRGNGTILLRQSSSWHRDEPNGGRQENCAAVREDGQWYDYPCTYKLPWVCEGRP
ncbi:macrophage mannose receptor 1-like isoform X1 [Rissa tridactyla]|uniref:macrophage mannose receptor 1-like isoform X1 n=1 Tax=Rissa tridactyla TaxID=75485 RepID=UPI0023BAA153|nr:macrophage mannose receptor 1-like isoform X1 [Rissa tridactyla]